MKKSRLVRLINVEEKFKKIYPWIKNVRLSSQYFPSLGYHSKLCVYTPFKTLFAEKNGGSLKSSIDRCLRAVEKQLLKSMPSKRHALG